MIARDDPAAAPVPTSPCDDIHPDAPRSVREGLGLEVLDHRRLRVAAPNAKAPADVVVARPGRFTRLPLLADPKAPELGVVAYAAIAPEYRGGLRAAGVHRVAPLGRSVDLEPEHTAVGAAVRLRDSRGQSVLVAFGDEGVAHVVRARKRLDELARRDRGTDSKRPRREIESVIAHDLDRNGAAELVVRTRYPDALDDAEVHVLWDNGEAIYMTDDTLDGRLLRDWSVKFVDEGHQTFVSVSTCCGAVEARWMQLARGDMTAVEEVRGDVNDAVCAEDLGGAPRLRIQAAGPRPQLREPTR